MSYDPQRIPHASLGREARAVLLRAIVQPAEKLRQPRINRIAGSQGPDKTVDIILKISYIFDLGRSNRVKTIDFRYMRR